VLNIYQELTGVNCRSSPIVSGAFTCTTCYCQVVYMETTALVFTGNGLEVQWRRIKYPYKCALLWWNVSPERRVIGNRGSENRKNFYWM